MHALVAAIHQKDSAPHDWMDRFLEDNQDYMENNVLNGDEILDSLKFAYEQALDNLLTVGPGHSRDYARDLCVKYESAQTRGEKLRAWATDNGYLYDDINEEVYEYTNPNAQCDYYLIGGRYEGSIITRDGIATSCPLKDFVRMDTRDGLPYVYTTETNYEWHQLDGNEVEWQELLERYNAMEGEWYITAVDIHY